MYGQLKEDLMLQMGLYTDNLTNDFDTVETRQNSQMA